MAIEKTLRSVSLPSRSHPTILRVEEELNKLKTRLEFQAASESTPGSSVCFGLSGIQRLYQDMNDVLNMSSTRELLSGFRNEKCLEDLLDGSVRLLDLCGLTRDILLQLEEQIQSLQSAFRRRKGDSSNIESSIQNYSCLRKKMKKDAKKFIAALKQLEIAGLEEKQADCHLIQLFKEVFVINSLVFQSLMLFLSAASKPKRSGWLMISKLMHRGAVTCEEKQETMNEMASADHAVLIEIYDSENIGIAQKRMEDLEMSIEDIEKSLEGVFRHLIKTRASILNIISL